ncbi:efflux RND transporter periplasmic adaptor subunit [Flavobacterium johnsoniae]|uniref:Efflux transporter, RND family, MFP subunit n=1 Tax=Flavobacterium johnsoniae (strain ATCC 17061 / DSM 2064 / JCM 8514 / BCRC 14874 / CCUG 350202 / NBRC 14942 / NCIMB 11054 / UW101) TaxID=376686 RepID=A5FKA3_FLAJ1|nr:HlyD family efflux transporter periplasmic adaptor subunit [Flavobacterium johnsoniae]ABQ04363.1 efflux transporter, RND family, MFP subunit [Flavobacterium johnsoniae UW101]OXE97691.1 RND transporter [Flavobacterium johnsoniae UW101]WQG83843.1 HlyD family efflux transporter periplasmic adaptor subunit [Flavobacterium johnsoniae UW101]SHK20276.1 HlyD family secretion protein [Flavobacterium johnsoniae]
MDKVIPRKNRKFRYLTIAIGVFLALAVIVFFSFNSKRSLNVKADELSVQKVEKAFFEDFVVFQAKVEPLNVMLVNVTEGGSVKEIFVENGATVTKGQSLARLYNPNTELNYLTQETAIIEQINNLNTGKLNIRNQELNLTKDLVLIEHDYNDAKRLYDVNAKLFAKDVISKNDWNTFKESLRFQEERRKTIQQSIQKEKQSNQLQISQINRSIQTMEKSLDILRNNKKNFLITAPESGRLTSFEPVLGKTFQAGESIGRIDSKQGYKLSANVDEFYLEKIREGLKGQVEFKGKTLEVVVTKVIPEVKNGHFIVELAFTSKENIVLQDGLSFGVKLILSEKNKILVVQKGSFNQETAGKWIFVVKGNKAEKRNIKLGRENPSYYEVLDGLKEGESVVISSYSDYKDIEELSIQ